MYWLKRDWNTSHTVMFKMWLELKLIVKIVKITKIGSIIKFDKNDIVKFFNILNAIEKSQTFSNEGDKN